jgi:hypothetical protein
MIGFSTPHEKHEKLEKLLWKFKFAFICINQHIRPSKAKVLKIPEA